MAVEFTTNYATGYESVSLCDQNPVKKMCINIFYYTIRSITSHRCSNLNGSPTDTICPYQWRREELLKVHAGGGGCPPGYR